MSFTPETLLRHWQTLRSVPRYPRKITAGEICNRLSEEGFPVGKRTVERDLLALSRIFPLLVDDREKPYGWSWDKESPAFDLPCLTTGESLALLMARVYLRSVMPNTVQAQLAPYFRQAEQRLDTLTGHSALADWMSKVRVIPATQPLLSPQINEDIEGAVHEALLYQRQCQISYLRKDSVEPDEYPISPLALVQRGVLTYLVCRIKNYPEPRILVLHRVISAELLDLPIQDSAEFDLDSYLANGAFGWGEGELIRLEALFTQGAGNHLYETPLSSDQKISVESDGRLRVVANLPFTKQLQWWLLGFGNGVEVIGPERLRDYIFMQLSSAHGLYKK